MVTVTIGVAARLVIRIECFSTITAGNTFFIEPGALRSTRTPELTFLYKKQANGQQNKKESEDADAQQKNCHNSLH
jgi:hypothetical protein